MPVRLQLAVADAWPEKLLYELLEEASAVYAVAIAVHIPYGSDELEHISDSLLALGLADGIQADLEL